jgi:hypothetical protein
MKTVAKSLLPIEIDTYQEIISTADFANYLKGLRAKIQRLHPPMNQHDGIKACVPDAPKNFKGKFLASSSQILSNHFKGIQDSKEMCRVQNITKKNKIGLLFNLTRICLT